MPEQPEVSSKKETTAGTPPAGGGKVRKGPIGRVAIKPELCKGCGYCVSFCPLAVLAMSQRFNAKGYHYPEVVDPSKCTGCDLCGMFCPDFAITGARMPSEDA